jgi:hypothetical protein
MEPTVKPRKLRIVSGPYLAMEEDLNRLMEEYAVMVWNIAVIGDVPHVTAVLILASEMRKAALMQGAGFPRQ